MATSTAIRTAREYARVSKGKGKTARSISDQHRENLAAERDHGPWTWGEAYVDTGSASKYATKIRDDFDRLTSDLAAGEFGAPGDVLVLWEISRLSRETGKGVKLIDLCEAGGYLIHVTELERTFNPANHQDRHDLIAGINDAETEARHLSKRVRRGTDSAVGDGRPHGKIPFGYRRTYELIDGRPRPVSQEPDPVEGPLVVELFERVAGWNGRTRESIRSVAVDWEARGIRSRGRAADGKTVPGVVLSRQYLAQVLKRRAYLGVRVHDGREYPGNWQPLVDPELYDAVQAILADPSRRSTTTTSVKHVLTGVLRCGTCGGKVSLRPGGKAYDGRMVYRCWDRDCFTADKAEVDAFLVGTPDRPGLVLGYLTRPDVSAQLRPEAEEAELAAVRAALTGKRRDLKEFEDAEPAITLAESRERARAVEALEFVIAALEKRENALVRPDPLTHLIETGPGAAGRWADTGITAQRAIAALLFAPDGPLGQPRIMRVADSASPAVADRLRFVGADGRDLAV